MNKTILILISIFLVIIVILYIINMYLKKSIENFGIYCGSYNLNKNTAQLYCTKDPECAWNSTKDPNTGLMNNWCSQNPNGVQQYQTKQPPNSDLPLLS